MIIQAKDEEIARLAEEVGTLQAAEAQLESRGAAEIRRANRELDELKMKHYKEVPVVKNIRKAQITSTLVVE